MAEKLTTNALKRRRSGEDDPDDVALSTGDADNFDREEIYRRLGIDKSNIIEGKRRRRAAKQYVHPDMDLLYKDVPEEERDYALGDVPTDEEGETGVLSDDDDEDDSVSHVSGIENDQEALEDDELSYVPGDDDDEEEETEMTEEGEGQNSETDDLNEASDNEDDEANDADPIEEVTQPSSS